MANTNVYEIVTERIIAKLSEGVAPWRKPWTPERPTIKGRPVYGPINAVTGKEYRGINVFLLWGTAFADSRWLTYKQAQEAGGSVKKGEKGSLVVFWKIMEVKEPSKVDPNREVTKKIPLLRYYTVFNVEQCENLNEKKIKSFDAPKEGIEVSPIEAAEGILDNRKNPCKVKHGGDRACYMRLLDQIQMPKPKSFESMETYYATRFHEEVHATGHESRVNREFGVSFGDDKYSKEELVAEMGAAFLCSLAGIDSNLDQSAAYVKGWLSRLQDDPKLVVFAASQAQKAVDYILGIETEEKGEEA